MTNVDRVAVLVPMLVGMEIVPAYRAALIAGVAINGQNPAAPLPPRGVIHTQRPTAGTKIWTGDTVTIWTTAPTV